MDRNILFNKAIPFVFLVLLLSLVVFANSAFAYTLEDLANSLQNLFSAFASCSCSNHICSSGCLDSGLSCQNPSDCEPIKCGDGKCASGIEDCGTCKYDCPCPDGYSCPTHQCVKDTTTECTSGQTPRYCKTAQDCDGTQACVNGKWSTVCTDKPGDNCPATTKEECKADCCINDPKYKDKSCPSNQQQCVNGKCQTSSSTTCTDSDGGQVLTSQGTCTSKSSTSTDSCYGDTVREFYCSSGTSTICSSYDRYCPTYCTGLGYKSGKCSGGACVCESGTSGKPSCDPTCSSPAPTQGCTKSTGGECTYPSARYYCEKTGGCYGQQWDCKVACGYQNCGIQGSNCGGNNPNCCDGFTCDTSTSKCVSNKPSCGSAGGRCVNSQTECTNFCGTNKQADYKTGYDCTNGCCFCLSKVQCTEENEKSNCAAYGSGECIVGACSDQGVCYRQIQTNKKCTTSDGKTGNCDASGKCSQTPTSDCCLCGTSGGGRSCVPRSSCYGGCIQDCDCSQTQPPQCEFTNSQLCNAECSANGQTCQYISINCYKCSGTTPPTNNCPSLYFGGTCPQCNGKCSCQCYTGWTDISPGQQCCPSTTCTPRSVKSGTKCYVCNSQGTGYTADSSKCNPGETCQSDGSCKSISQQDKENCKNKEANVKYCSVLNAVEAGWVCKLNQGEDTSCNKGQCEYKIISSTFCKDGCDSVKGECNAGPVTTKCRDGTELDQCSATKPMKCARYGTARNLVDDCNKCECPDPTKQYCEHLGIYAGKCLTRLDDKENCELYRGTTTRCEVAQNSKIPSVATYGMGCAQFGNADDNCPKGKCGFVRLISRQNCPYGCDASTNTCKPEPPQQPPKPSCTNEYKGICKTVCNIAEGEKDYGPADCSQSGVAGGQTCCIPAGVTPPVPQPERTPCLTLPNAVCRGVECLPDEERLDGECRQSGVTGGGVCCKIEPAKHPELICQAGTDVAKLGECLEPRPTKAPWACLLVGTGKVDFRPYCNQCGCPNSNEECNDYLGSCSPKVLNSQLSPGSYQYGVASQNVLTLIIPVGSRLSQPIVVSDSAYTNYNVLSKGFVKAITFMWVMWDPEFKVITNTYDVDVK